MALNSLEQGSTIANLHSDITETHLLTKFDGPSLASLASTCHSLRTLCNKDDLWEDICNSTWNSIKQPIIQQIISSFPRGYRSFYCDSFPVISPSIGRGTSRGDHVQTSELISAVDMHYGNYSVYSKVVVTDTDSSGFVGSLFSVDLIEYKETVEIPMLRYEDDENDCMLKIEENMKLSWIVIDPSLKRAANVSSLRPVSVRPIWDGTGIKVIYATIVSGDCWGIDTTKFVEFRIVATFVWDEGTIIELKDLSLCVVDMVTTYLNGEKSLTILKGAMESGERKKENGEGKKMYRNYLEFKRKVEDDKKKFDRVLWALRAVLWVFFAISLGTSLWFALS